MIIVTTIFLALMAFIAVRHAMAPRPERVRSDTRLHTFIVDPLTFFLLAFVTVMAAFRRGKGRAKLSWRKFVRRRQAIDVALTVFLLGFWVMEILTYFNVLGHPFDPSKTGNDFMWNGYVEWLFGPVVDTTVPTYESLGMNVLALGLLLLQFAALRLGRWFGYMTTFFNDLDNWSRPDRH